MVGVIWIMQIVHYPAFKYIRNSDYHVFQEFHMRRISFIVIPAMLAEIVTGSIILYLKIHLCILFKISFVFLILIWISTGLVFSKIHNDLLKGFKNDIGEKLVQFNWIRTALWSLRLILLLSI